MDFFNDEYISRNMIKIGLTIIIAILPYIIKKDNKNKKKPNNAKKTVKPREDNIQKIEEEKRKKEQLKREQLKKEQLKKEQDAIKMQKKKRIFEEDNKKKGNKNISENTNKSSLPEKKQNIDTDIIKRRNEINNIKTKKVEEKDLVQSTDFDLQMAFIYSEILQKPLALRK
ncbi:MAG: hypothetical protein HXL16_02235 [Peptostreptococcaceae bacterium]|jgi:hypothetical protein|nr:hypothetical protein [Peptostreptococcaceae bacterium]